MKGMLFLINMRKTSKTMIAQFNHLYIKERMIDFFRNIFIVKKILSDKSIIHYFEWGNKKYDVITHKQYKCFEVYFKNYIPKF